MKKSMSTMTIIFILLIIAIVGYYAYLSNRRQENQKETQLTTVQNVLARDLKLEYPVSPREVIKYYNEIMKCFYNEELTEEDLEGLAQKSRQLFDDELVLANEYDSYLQNLKSEIDTYKLKKRKITNCSVAASTSVDFYSVDGFEFARLSCGYTMMENGKSIPTHLVYLLRQDDKKQWKIYGWDLAENLRINED